MALFGLIYSWWAIVCLPVAILIGYAFSGAGLGASSFMRSFIDFDFVNLAVLPMFLLSATFFPLSEYPEGVQWIVRLTPLYQGVALERAFVFGELQWSLLLDVLYLAVMGTVGRVVAGRRLRMLLLP
jgi:lipooligosaccharide transport system permease protein